MGRAHAGRAAPIAESAGLTDIIIKQNFSVADIKQARIKRAVYRPPKTTSAASNVLNMADTGASVMLCEAHVRAFATPAVLSKYGYRQVKDTKVAGNCDYCKVHQVCTLFLREDDFNAVWGFREKQRVNREYGAVCAR